MYLYDWIKRLFSLLLLLGLFSSVQAATDCSAVTEIPVSECETLLELYNSTDGENWDNSSDWNITNTPCSWYGVDCGGGNQVIALRLPANGLKGNITDLSALQNMWSLQLSQNRLTGNIAWLSQLTNLQSVELQENREHIDNSWCSSSH